VQGEVSELVNAIDLYGRGENVAAGVVIRPTSREGGSEVEERSGQRSRVCAVTIGASGSALIDGLKHLSRFFSLLIKGSV
jgi:hypothetical protein